MTLKQLSIELGKPTHVLINTLRQIGLAAELLSEDSRLTLEQENHLRKGKAQTEKRHKDSDGDYSNAVLAQKYNQPYDVKNIVKSKGLMADSEISPKTQLTADVYAAVESILAGISEYIEKKSHKAIKSSEDTNDKTELDELHKSLDERDKYPSHSEIWNQLYSDKGEEEAMPEAKYTLQTLAIHLNIAEDRVKNILVTLYEFDRDVLKANTIIKDWISKKIISDYEILAKHDQAQQFENLYLQDALVKWENPIVPKAITQYTPGTIIEGTVYSIDNDSKEIKVKFKELSHIKRGFWNDKKVVDRPEKYGGLPFTEWDWEILEEEQRLPQPGTKSSFLVLQNEYGKDLRLSRRQAIAPLPPINCTVKIIANYPKYGLIAVRGNNGVYGFLPYSYIFIGQPYIKSVIVGEEIETIVKHHYKKHIDGRIFFFAEFDIKDAQYRDIRKVYRLDLTGINYTNMSAVSKLKDIEDWDDFIKAYKEGSLIEARITEVNAGGYLLTTLNESRKSFELFCPFSKSPTWIESSINKKLINETWLVKIVSDPEGEGNNTIVSARLNTNDYDGILKTDGFYYARVCSCNEYGANVLVVNTVPMFVPNNHISWKVNYNALTELTLGEIVIVKILKNEKGTIASINQATVDPWIRVSEVYPVGSVVEGTVVKKEARGIHLTLGEYKLYLPADKISWTEFITDCATFDTPDSILRMVVTGYSEKSHTIQVSLRDLEADPWERIDAYISADSSTLAVVKSLTLSGIHLTVGDRHFDGYLSYRDVDWCKEINKDSFPYQVGDTIQVRVIRCDKQHRKLTCSIKALTPNPWEEIRGIERIEGTVTEVKDDCASVLFANGIRCLCNEVLPKDLEGQTLEFDVQHLDIASQKIIISYRKQEIEALNTLAMGEMFKAYQAKDKGLLQHDEQDEDLFRRFTIKEVSSTGRVTATYAEEDSDYETGILLPTAVTVNGYPVNIIFARQIMKKHMQPGDQYVFRISHSYEDIPFAVLSFDAADLLKLDEISIADFQMLKPGKKICVNVLQGMNTPRHIFVHWKGYFGYIPRGEVAEVIDDIDQNVLELTVSSTPSHPEQMIRFSMPNATEEQNEKEEIDNRDSLAESLYDELRECYNFVTKLPNFNHETPDRYPYSLELRYDPEKHPTLHTQLTNSPADLTTGLYFMTCTEPFGKNCKLTIFNSEIILEGKRVTRDDVDEFIVENSCLAKFDEELSAKSYGRPLKLYGDNLSIVPLNSSVLPPSTQKADVIWELLEFNRKVLPKLNQLGKDFLKERGSDYLTLQRLLKMEYKREEELGRTSIPIRSGEYHEVSSSLGGIGLIFEAQDDTFDDIISKDDSEEGTMVLAKANDGSPMPPFGGKLDPSVTKGRLRSRGNGRWSLDLLRDSNLEIDDVRRLGLLVKRSPNLRHIKKQIFAIDSFVYEKNGLDILGKIARNKLVPPKPLDYVPLTNPHINSHDASDSQSNAIRMALGGSKISLIQGPPGTGKSTVIVDIIRNLVKQGKKVLVCTQSVAPIEELYRKVTGFSNSKSVGNPIEVDGHPLRCAYLRDSDSLELSSSVKERVETLKAVHILTFRLQTHHASAQDERDASTSKNKDAKDTVAEFNSRGAEHITTKFMKEILPHADIIDETLSEYINALSRDDVETFYSNDRTLQKDAVDVVFGTCIGVGVSSFLKDLHFDTLIIDEAGKANYAETLVPMMMADEYILVGDDKQLPPYTNSELVKEMALNEMEQFDPAVDDTTLEEKINKIMEAVSKSLFEDLRALLPDAHTTLLRKQFRMHPVIGDFVSRLFYDGSVESITKAEERTINIEGLENPLQFIDTSEMGIDARESRASQSLYNDGEIKVIEENLIDKLIAAKRVGKTVGILSPYGAQVMRMKDRFQKYDLAHNIFTIGSIQGEEYDIVVFSFVRNTHRGNLNFIDSLNRLNVSFSRAKCNLIMVGHLKTLCNKDLHKDDWDKVEAIYDEIESNNIAKIVHPGAMQKLYEDFPPISHPILENLDEPYMSFNHCRVASGGNFTALYNNQLLKIFNPILKGVKLSDDNKEFVSHLIGFVDSKPYTMIEPMSNWLNKGVDLKKFNFSAEIVNIDNDRYTFKLFDESQISLRVPLTLNLHQGDCVIIIVTSKYKSGKWIKQFVIKLKENE